MSDATSTTAAIGASASDDRTRDRALTRGAKDNSRAISTIAPTKRRIYQDNFYQFDRTAAIFRRYAR